MKMFGVDDIGLVCRLFGCFFNMWGCIGFFVMIESLGNGAWV